MEVLELIHVGWFIAAFAVGILYVYLKKPEAKIVLKFPTPYNAGKITYKDKSDTCYRYKAEKTSCPLDKSKVVPQPLFEDFPVGAPEQENMKEDSS